MKKLNISDLWQEIATHVLAGIAVKTVMSNDTMKKILSMFKAPLFASS